MSDFTLIDGINCRIRSVQFAGALINTMERRSDRALLELVNAAFCCDEDDFEQGQELAAAENESELMTAQLQHAQQKLEWEQRDYNFGATK